MQNFALSLLKSLGLAYWVTVMDSSQKKYTFGPFTSASHAISLQERCCQQLRDGVADIGAIISVRVSMEA